MTTSTCGSQIRIGRNFSNDEERQVCRSVLQISQNPIQGNGQRKEAFWDRVSRHFNQNRPSGVDERPKRSLETKWGVIKHDVSKFISVYNHCYSVRESGTSLDDVLQNALGLYKTKDAKQRSFVFLHCWLLLKECPRWMETPGERVPSAPQRPRRAVEAVEAEPTHIEDLPDEDADPALTLTTNTLNPQKQARPVGNKVAKEDQRVLKQKENALHVQAQATKDLAAANALKAETLRDQAILSLFTMPEATHLSDQAREYIEMRRDEEMEKLRDRTEARKVAKARLAVAAAREARENGDEVARATANWMSPTPMVPPLTSSPTPAPAEDSQASEGVRSQNPNRIFLSQDDYPNRTQEFSQQDNEFDGDEASPTQIFDTEEDLHRPEANNTAADFQFFGQSQQHHNEEEPCHILSNSLLCIQTTMGMIPLHYNYPQQFGYFGQQVYSPHNANSLLGFHLHSPQASRVFDPLAPRASSARMPTEEEFLFR